MTEWVDVGLALLTLTALETVLGIDNIVFIAILAGRLPKEQRNFARRVGLLAALGMRVIMLLGIGWIMKLTTPLFEVFDHGFSGKDLILLFGGLFLIGKATHEIHAKLEGEDPDDAKGKAGATMGMVIGQIAVMDMIFSIDSVITAVGMAEQLWVMITAVSISIAIMMIFARSISNFVERHPTVKMLALSFLVLIGVFLMAEGFHVKISKGYIYFAMGFSLFVEMLNLWAKKRREAQRDAVQLRGWTMPSKEKVD